MQTTAISVADRGVREYKPASADAATVASRARIRSSWSPVMNSRGIRAAWAGFAVAAELASVRTGKHLELSDPRGGERRLPVLAVAAELAGPSL
jgi:hypothetical protein